MSKSKSSKTAKPPPPDPELDITYDKASKFYEPGETVTGTVNIFKITGYQNHGEIKLHAEAFMDTVSQIRGNMGRPALRPDDRTVMMSKEMQLSSGGTLGPADPVKFEFVLEKTT